MENIVKQIQLLALVIILGATVIAFGIEIYQTSNLKLKFSHFKFKMQFNWRNY